MTRAQWLYLPGVAVGLLALGSAINVWGQTSAPGPREQHGGMGTPMPGMQMPSPQTAAAAPGTTPPGFAPVTIVGAVQQRIGVTLGQVERAPLLMRIRTVGIVRPDETRVAHIHLRTEGWVTKLFVSFTGQKVNAGEELLSIYSPAFFAAQRELLTALQTAKAVASPEQRLVVEAARQRLQLWDVPQDEIEALEKTGKVLTSLPLRTPISGTVLEKKAFEGQYVAPQDELYVVADLSTVWVQAKVYVYELPHVALGMPVTVLVPAFPEQQFTGKVVFIDPTVEEPARTVQVRIELSNTDGQFKPGMFTNVLIAHEMGQGLTIPTSAVIRTGMRDIAYRVAGEGVFVPVEVRISPLRFDNHFQLLEGLAAGDAVVTSASFLIDSESRLRAGAAGMAGMPGMTHHGDTETQR